MPETTSLPREGQPCRVLIIDNYDSFTYNIREVLAKIGVEAIVARNDEIGIEEVTALNPSHIIVSPGPGTPENPEDIGITSEVIEYAVKHRRALLGICLGHQALAHHFGGKIERAEEILHGKTSGIAIAHQDDLSYPDLFEGIGDSAEVMRYHSLAADEDSLPEVFRVTARTRDRHRTIMAMQHQGSAEQEALPIYGVQFHPESFATPSGMAMLRNFLNVDSEAFGRLKENGLPSEEEAEDSGAALPLEIEDALRSVEQRQFSVRDFPCDLPSEEVYARLHGVSGDCFCLESMPTDGGESHHRHSFFGIAPQFVLSARNEKCFLDDGEVPLRPGTNPMDALDCVLSRLRRDAAGEVPEGQSFSGGLVGFTAYEAIQYTEPKALSRGRLTPDNERTFSYGYFEDGLVYDNERGTYQYFTRGRDRHELFRQMLEKPVSIGEPTLERRDKGVPQEEYERQVGEVLERVRAGETFQTVLSRRELFHIEGSMAPLYSRLRSIHPSGCMHAIRMGDMESIGSFPELVLRVEEGKATTYQLAGTRKRTGSDEKDQAVWEGLIADPKERAEHIMLVDLARNDLARSMIPGSVEVVPERLMSRLNAGPVMHIASEIRGRINGLSPLRALLNILPMGTVSGAPKVRSMEIIAGLEQSSRGLYAGSVGFLDLRGDLRAVVGLRSIMRAGDELKVQAGAGIVYDSDPASEYAETQKKMQAAEDVLHPFLIP